MGRQTLTFTLVIAIDATYSIYTWRKFLTIGIDARFAIRNRRGMGSYVLNLVRNLAAIDRSNQYILYTDTIDSDKLLPQTNNFETKILQPANYLLWEQLALPQQALKDNLDILHCTFNTAPLILDKKIRLITTIHDVMYLKPAKELADSTVMYQRLGRIYRSLIVSKTIYKADRIITVSEFSKQDILSHFPTLDPSRISTTYEAADDIFLDVSNAKIELENVSDKFGIISNYILTLGATDPRKNTEKIIRIFAKLKQEQKISEQLVIVGIPNWRNSDFYALVCDLQCQSDIIFTDFITQLELCSLYKYASIFLYISLYEGFGIPPLEAMACGTPVIVSNVTSIPEIVGDAAIQVDPYNQAAIENSILEVLKDRDLADNLVAKGRERLKNFSWHKMAESTHQLYLSTVID